MNTRRPFVEFVEALEEYLIDTGQLHPLAKRQAKTLCRFVADHSVQVEARVLLLLNLVALARGAPRAPRKFLLRPIESDVVAGFLESYKREHPDAMPSWEAPMADAAAIEAITAVLDAALRNSNRHAPLTGEEPRDKNDRYPLLVINGQSSRMGFSRYWRAAASLETEICNRLDLPLTDISDVNAASAIAYVFGTNSILGPKGAFHYRQTFAAALALRTNFLIVSGGPGTGKTRVVLQVLRTLLHACKEIEPDQIVLCAPTGRAKARLGESIDAGIDFLATSAPANTPEIKRDMIMRNLARKTIHGLLGVRPDGSAKFHKENLLPYKVIVIDEASMVDLHLFWSMMEAAASDCRIILVGDMHQLPSVEAGAVLGDLTHRFAAIVGYPSLTEKTARWVNTVISNVPCDGASRSDTPDSLVLSTNADVERAGRLADHVVVLTHSYRSVRDILDISESINNGNIPQSLVTTSGNSGAPAVVLDNEEGMQPIAQWLHEYYSDKHLDPIRAMQGLDVEAVANPEHHDHSTARSLLDKAFEVFEASRILTLAHEGRRGRHAVNAFADALIRSLLGEKNRKRFFHGQQIILEQNLHYLDLYNGDTGFVVESKNAGTKVVFRRGKVYSFHPLECLSGIESAFAMTVHKSQGSEFDAVLLVLPDYKSPLLTRQVLYTGITRAKRHIRILGSAAQLQTAVETREERPGGIEL